MSKNIPYIFVIMAHIVLLYIYFNVSGWDSGFSWSTLGVVCTMLLQFSWQTKITRGLKDGPVKIYSLIPFKFERWHFVFYAVDHTTLMPPEDLFAARMKGKPVTQHEKFKADMDDIMNGRK